MSNEKFPNLDTMILKDAAIFFGWIAGIILIAGICWAVTQPVRNLFLIRAVNRVLEQSGDSRRLGELSPLGRSGSLMGTLHTLTQVRQPDASDNENPAEPQVRTEGSQSTEGEKVYVFSFIGEGTFFPCAAIITAEKKVVEFIPLSSHGVRIISHISPGILKLYARRIERIKL